MVGGEAETGLVAGDEVSDRKRPVAARGATVDDDEVNASHLKIEKLKSWSLTGTLRVEIVQKYIQIQIWLIFYEFSAVGGQYCWIEN